jgi:hypothetical protein
LEQLLVVHLKKWLSAGRRYMSLANELGGLGALLVLPDFRPTYFEEHYHPTGGDRPGIIPRRLEGSQLRKLIGHFVRRCCLRVSATS